MQFGVEMMKILRNLKTRLNNLNKDKYLSEEETTWVLKNKDRIDDFITNNTTEFDDL